MVTAYQIDSIATPSTTQRNSTLPKISKRKTLIHIDSCVYLNRSYIYNARNFQRFLGNLEHSLFIFLRRSIRIYLHLSPASDRYVMITPNISSWKSYPPKC